MSRQIHIWNFNSICRKMTKKSPENENLAKGNNSCKSSSNATKVKLDLCYIKTNPYTKFQVNISKDDGEKFGKPSGRTPSGLTDWLTDGQKDRRTDRMTDGDETYSPPGLTGRGLKKNCRCQCLLLRFGYMHVYGLDVLPITWLYGLGKHVLLVLGHFLTN